MRDLYRFTPNKSVKENPPKRKPKIFLKVLVWILVVLAICVPSFFWGGKLAADYLFESINPYSFFKNGKYLILFQNDSELRSSGGFIGSFAVLELKDFSVKNISFETNIYKLDTRFTKTNYVKAPGPLANFIHGKSWTLRDSNYDVSFPEAAADILDFYNKETGDSVDGVVAINASTILDLLKFTGPIKMDKYNTTISAENFYVQTQIEIQKDYYQNPENALENEPKTIIKDLYPEVISRALAQNKIDLLGLLSKELRTKNIQLYFEDRVAENIVKQKGWGGEVRNGTPDYLNINVNNFGGNKSSLSVAMEVQYQVDPNGLAELSISRTHHGSTAWPDGVNSSYIRVLTPKGSMLETASLNGRDVSNGIDKTIEADKTSFGTTVAVGPGQASILKLSYRLPFEIKNYGLTLQKQSGAPKDTWKIIYDKRVLSDKVLDHDLYLK